MFAASSDQTKDKWIQILKDIKDEILKQIKIQKQREIDELKDLKKTNENRPEKLDQSYLSGE